MEPGNGEDEDESEEEDYNEGNYKNNERKVSKKISGRR